MSGPKSSDVHISQAERARQEEERQRRILEEKCKMMGKEIIGRNTRMLQTIENTLREAKVLIPESPTINDIEKIKYLLETRVDDTSLGFGERSAINMKELFISIELRFQDTLDQEPILENYLRRLGKQIADQKLNNAENDFLTGTKSLRPNKFLFDLSSPAAKMNQTKSASADLGEVLLAFNLAVEEYLNNDFLEDKQEIIALRNSVEKILDNERLDDSYKLEQINIRRKAFLLECEKYQRQIEKNRQAFSEFQDLHLTYLALSKMLDENPKPFAFQVGRTGFDKVVQLSEEIELCKATLVNKEETLYIACSINEVMGGLGYEVVASEILSTAKSETLHNIYSFEKSNVINVFTSDQGSLMFEVTGVKATNNLTALEEQRIKEGMDSFCGKYDQIKDKLREKGIEVTGEDLKPAHVRYAKAINLDDKKLKMTKLRSTSGKQLSVTPKR